MQLPITAEPAAIAWFLDFDGTLVEIAERPDAVLLEERTRLTLERLHRLSGGALAIITGREIATIDTFLAPLHLPIAGVHGLTRRDFAGGVHEPTPDPAFLMVAASIVEPLARTAPELVVERKAGALALHYRARPDLEDACLAAMEAVAARCNDVRLVRGKMVIEARTDGADKGSAVAAFLAEPPFLGRRPLFAGDDVTDEDAFAEVNARGGISIKIGPGATAARWRADDASTFLAWLARVVAASEPTEPSQRAGVLCIGEAS
jgi:trehalose 6-phosphate phosphatase